MDDATSLGETDYLATRWVSLDSAPAHRPALEVPLTVNGALRFVRSQNPNADSSVVDTRESWELLATLACADLGIARAIEPHLDALSILSDARAAGHAVPALDGSWGVFAAEGGPDPLVGTLTDSGWCLQGTKPWCSLADRLDRALVTASNTDGSTRLFAVDLRNSGVQADPKTWHARGLSEIPSGPVHFRAVPAVPVGEPGWYLQRIGFAWGGIGVAACWFGGAVAVARSLFAALSAQEPSPHQLVHLGAVDELIQTARMALRDAAGIVDGQLALPRADASILAKRVRATVARTCEEILWRSGHALGPAPLALDRVHAKRVADLQLYIRQHHAERDQASLGSALLVRGRAPW